VIASWPFAYAYRSNPLGLTKSERLCRILNFQDSNKIL
jgi:hypothetical protein